MELNLEQQHEGLSFSVGLKDFGRKLLNFLFYLITTVLSLLGWSKKSSHDPELTEIHSKSPDHQEQFATSAGTSPIAPSSIASENVLDNLKDLTIQAVEKESSDVVPRTADVNLPEPAADETKNTLVIKNLPFKFSKQELDDLLMKYEAKSKNVRMMKDGQGRFTGIVFIRCPSKDEAAKLIISMNNLEIGGRNIQVEFKKKKKKKATANANEALSSDSEMSAPPSLRSSGEVSLESIKPNNLVMSQDSQKVAKQRKVDIRRSSPAVIENTPPMIITERRRSVDEKFIPRFSLKNSQNAIVKSGIAPIRQPIGPDGKSCGFSAVYRNSRTIVN